MRILLFVLLSLLFFSCAETKIKKDHILFIYTDDQAQYSDQYLDQVMPNVHSWVKERGVKYTNYICSTPYCAPSRATVLTGMYPHNTGHYNNTTSYKDFYSRFGDETLGTWMQRAGYHTIFIGKYFNPNFPSSVDKKHVPEGWDDFVAMRGGKYLSTPFTIKESNTAFNRITPETFRRSEFEIKTLIEYIQHYIAKNSSKPLFIYYAPFEPHNPRKGEKRSTMYQEGDNLKFEEIKLPDLPLTSNGQNIHSLYKDRFRSLFSLDKQLGRLFRFLDSKNLYDDMFVFFTSDNGFMLGQRELFGKQVPYNPSVLLPFYVKHPNDENENTVCEDLIGTVDLVPTFLQIGEGTQLTDGQNIFLNQPREYIYAEMIQEGQDKPSWYMLRSTEEVLIGYEDNGYEYYNLNSDPTQTNNSYSESDHAHLVVKLNDSKVCKMNCP